MSDSFECNKKAISDPKKVFICFSSLKFHLIWQWVTHILSRDFRIIQLLCPWLIFSQSERNKSKEIFACVIIRVKSLRIKLQTYVLWTSDDKFYNQVVRIILHHMPNKCLSVFFFSFTWEETVSYISHIDMRSPYNRVENIKRKRTWRARLFDVKQWEEPVR